jgi:cell wall assembly regulator SMI1
MKELKISGVSQPASTKEQIFELEKRIAVLLPEDLKELMLKYEGGYLDESQKIFKSGEVLYEVNQMLHIEKSENKASVEAIFEGHKFYGIEGHIPFATDSGGWDFTVSINPSTYGQVWINKFDNDEEDTMCFVAGSLEAFINGLKGEHEV